MIRILFLFLMIVISIGYGAEEQLQSLESLIPPIQQPNHSHVSLTFQDIEVRAVLQQLADFIGINIVISDAVSGSISLRLHDLPWEEALNIILASRSLGQRKLGNVIFIAPLKEITAHEKELLKEQKTRTELAPLHSSLLQINYAKANEIANLLQDKKVTLLSPRGRLGVDIRTNAIWIKDTITQIKMIKSLIKQLDIPVKQVLIEARIVNVTKDFARDLGLHFNMSDPSQLEKAREDEVKKVSLGANSFMDRLNLDLALIPSMPGTSVGLALAKLSNGILLDLELSALESEGRGEVISNPKIITTNQQTARIESGEEIPYQETTNSGATAVVFKRAVLSLKVTPQITPDQKILMDLQINQDTLSPKVFNGAPSILTKEIETKVLVRNGQTIVLGGIYKQDKNNEINRVPFLSDLPMIGNLFKGQNEAIRNEELLIFITPRIIMSNLLTKEAKKEDKKQN